MDDKKSAARVKRQKMMLEDPMIRVIPAVAIPMIISSIIDSVYNLADTFFVSGLGEVATAAVAVNDSLMNILRAVAMGFAMGAASYISRLMGAKQDERASNVATTTLAIGCIFSLLFGLVCFAIKGTIVDLFGSTAEAHQYSVDYATWILLAAPFTTANLVLNQLLRSEGSTTYAMIGMCSGCILNCLLDPLFINVLGWGVAGAAGATALSKLFSCIILMIPYVTRRAMLEISPKHFYIDFENVKEVARMGIPAFLRMSLMSLGGIVTNNVAKGFGTAVLAGIAVANKLYRLIGSVIMGFSQGFSPVAGFCWGARKYKRAKQSYYTTLAIGFTGALVLGTLMFIFAKPLIGVFNSSGNETMLRIGSFKIRSLCIVFIPHVFVMVTSNLYQSLGKPMGNLILSLSRQLLVLIPLVLIIPRFFQAEGLACCQALSDLISGLLLALPFAISMMRKINKLQDGDPPPFGRTSARG
ncbi:MAG: MATE family efflux transporter [Oscillospiraceae bacterium]|nr:MATE family efflux transporter [Oscillospiraceae bacterium]